MVRSFSFVLLGTLTVLLLAAPRPASAHGVHVQQQNTRAVSVEFSYDDLTPMSFEQYEVLAPDADAPFQVGRTDGLGRVVFRPDREGSWQVRVWTEDGHGGSTAVQVNGDMLATEELNARSGRLNKIITGIAVLFGLFGLLALVKRV